MTTPKTPFEQVKEFHKTFKQPMTETNTPSLETIEDRVDLRMDLIAEEFIELVEAVYGVSAGGILIEAWDRAKEADEHNRDLIETVDALADSVYVINGFAVELNVDLDAVSSHVHDSNMSKLDENNEPIISDGSNGFPKGKIMKGVNFWQPDIAKVIGLDNKND